MIDDILELFRAQISIVYILVIVPTTLCAFAPQTSVVVQEFRAYRIQQYDLAGTSKGTRSWKVNFDATSLDSNLLRRCLIVSWKSLVSAQLSLTDLLPASLGAVVIVIPARLSELTDDEQQEFMSLEERLLGRQFSFAIYVVPQSPEVMTILMNVELQRKQEHGSALSALLSMVTAYSYHFVSGIQDNSVTLPSSSHNILAKLSSFDRNDKVPSILLVAHYDSFGLAPALSFGADSNGSGLVALLELLRIFSRIYESGHTRAKYNLLFLLSGAGKLNYMGSRQYIDDYLEHSEASNAPLSKLEFAICLDSLLSDVDESDLFMHVSKVPTADSSIDKFYQRFQAAAQNSALNATIVSKKINLADELLAWEHERFSIRKLYAFTLSHLSSYKHPKRRSILDLNTGSTYRTKGLSQNIEVIANALASHIFKLDVGNRVDDIFPELKVDGSFVESWFDRVSGRPRSQQNFTLASTSSSGSPQPKDQLLVDLLALVNHHSTQANLVPIKLDKRDPEFVLYGATVDKLYAYRVKPAVFDLILALVVAGYLGLIYLLVLNASVLQYKLRFWIDSVKKSV